MSETPITVNRKMWKYIDGQFVSEEDEIATEYPLTLYVNDEEFATVVCSPDDLEALIIGFLASEGVIRAFDEIENLTLDASKGIAYVDLYLKPSLDPGLFSKRRITSCCGKSRQSFYFFSDAQTAKKNDSRLIITPEQCIQLMNALHERSSIHQNTGGVHNAALCTPEQTIIRSSDIGRHNALDKIYGYCLKNKIRTDDKIVVISGRISSEMLLKTAKIGSGILLSKSAPTDLALELADELGITAVGFIRGQKLNVYTHADRFSIPGHDT